jgi:hypothetical protein
MKRLIVDTDFVYDMEELGDAERGRLFTALLEYAGQGKEPDFRGNERYLWSAAKKNVDKMAEKEARNAQKRSEAGKKGASKRWQTIANDSKCHQEGFSPLNPPSSLSPEPPISSPPYNPPSSQEKKGRKTPKRFTPPTVEEVKAYCLDRKNGLDAQAFVDFYSSKGWKVGNNPMKDWKAAVRTWENRRKGEAAPKEVKKSNFDSEAYYKKVVHDMGYSVEDVRTMYESKV